MGEAKNSFICLIKICKIKFPIVETLVRQPSTGIMFGGHCRHKMMLLTSALLMTLLSLTAEAEFFSALGDMRTLLDHQHNFVGKLDNYVKEEEERLDLIKQFLGKIESRFGGPQGPPIAALTSIEADSSSLISNPLNAFLLIKYLSQDLGRISATMYRDVGSEFLTKLANDSSIKTPTFDDYKGAVGAIMRLQETYNIDAKTMADGLLAGIPSTAPMTAADCFNFGRTAYLEKDWVLTVSWMKEALVRERAKADPIRPFLGDILDHLAYSTSKTGNFKGALHWAEQLNEVNPAHERVAGYLRYFKAEIQKQIHTRGTRGDSGEEKVATLPEATSLFDRDYWEERHRYQALCRGDKGAVKLTPPRAAKLKCKYHHGNKPRLLLSPAKVEEVFDNPRIMVLHDIVNDEETEEVLSHASGRLRRATARNARTGQFEPADYRISKSTWLGPATSRTVRSIFDRVSDITNLDMTFSEDLQVNNYGIGGMYDPHFDFSRDHEKAFKSAYGDNRGNRIATVLFYFSDVEAGGATVFPTVGAAVQPIKGSAVFWYNLLPSGDGDLLTRHAGCPVLVGSKWVANFWIHEGGQEFRRRCRRHRHARR